jgi:hypothetical protein
MTYFDSDCATYFGEDFNVFLKYDAQMTENWILGWKFIVYEK